MTELKDRQWITRLDKIEHAFQPIVNIHTGNTFGFEALLRGHREAGFSSIEDVFNQACHQELLHQVDLYLRKKAFIKFAAFKKNKNIKLFYNLDNRLFDSGDYAPGNTVSLIKEYGYERDEICFEISEKHPFHPHTDISNIMAAYRSQGYKIAVDDCGTGFSGLQLLYYAEPDYIKIDRFFIQNMDNDPKKRLVVSTIVSFAHFMGSLVLAEGVETMDEYLLCRDIGCDMVQGYFVQPPELDLSRIKDRYEEIGRISIHERRNGIFRDQSLIAGEIEYIKPAYTDFSIVDILDRFREGENTTFFPIINRQEEPVGVVKEATFKQYIFSKFGRQILENRNYGKDITKFISRIPIADIHSSVEKLIETYTHYSNNEGLIIVDDMKYIGVLSTRSLLKLINEKNLIQARNQNPLTRLPGNTMIHEYFSKSLSDTTATYHLIYFDFDNFKPYNDKYGFRNGDRLILMFADLLRKAGFSDNRFVGHIGGDDFFMGIKDNSIANVMDEMTRLGLRFKGNAESFYDPETLENGFITATDREQIERKIPLITVSIAVLELPRRTARDCSIEKAGNIIAMLKKQAKQSETGLAFAGITEFLSPETAAPDPFETRFCEILLPGTIFLKSS